MSDERVARVDWKRSYYAEAENADALRKECEALRKDAERYRLMAENIDYTDNGDGTGFYWHNQRGEFSFEYRDDPDGVFRPTFESVIDAAVLTRKAAR